MNKKNAKKIFVVGCPRSGTTLLQNLLLNIPGSYSMPETSFFQFLPDNHYAAIRSLPPFLNPKYPEIIKFGTFNRIIDFMKKKANLKLSPEIENELKGKIEKGILKPKNFFEALMLSYADSSKFILIEKTPVHIYHVSYIKTLFPDAIVINIIRDPRDAYVSFNDMLKFGNKPIKERTVAEFSYLWNSAVDLSFKNNIGYIRYEDLVAKPLETINGALNRHNLSIKHLSQNRYQEIIQEGEAWKSNIKLEILKNRAGRYKNILNKEEINELEGNCYKNMKKFGYTLNTNSLFSPRYFKNRILWKIKKLLMLYRIILIDFKNHYLNK